MEKEKRRGRPRLDDVSDESQRYRSAPEKLEELKSDRLDKMKRYIKRSSRAANIQSGGSDVNLTDGKVKVGMHIGGANTQDVDNAAFEGDFKEAEKASEIKLNSHMEGDSVGTGISETLAKEIKSAFSGAFAGLGEVNSDFEKLTYAQIEALGKVCKTDDVIDEMLITLEDSGANQRWLRAAKASFQCAMMEIYRAVLKPRGC